MSGTSLIPIGDDDRGVRRTHFIVWILIGINVAVFIRELLYNDAQLTRFVHQYGAIPYEITRLQDIPPVIDYPILVTIFTSMFLHGGILHIAGNMLFLWIFGDNIEDVMGHGKFLLFYLICGAAAVMAQVVIDPGSQTPIIGASGAISGVMGAYLILFPGGAVRVAAIIWIIPLIFRLPAVIVIGLWFVFQILSGFATIGVADVQSGTAYFAHIGGFIAGVVLVFLFADRSRSDYQKARRRL